MRSTAIKARTSPARVWSLPPSDALCCRVVLEVGPATEARC